MALSKSFKELVQRRVAEDSGFAEALLREGIGTMADRRCRYRQGDPARLYQGHVGFEKLGKATDTPPKSLIRMFGPRGNPQARNLFGIICYLQKQVAVDDIYAIAN